MEKILLALIPTALVFGALYWTMVMGMREQERADRFCEEWLRARGQR